MWSCECVLAPVDVGANPLLPFVEILVLLCVGVVGAVVVRARAVLDLPVAVPRVELELPAVARLDGLELLPGQVLRVAVLDAADVDEHDGFEAHLLEDAVAAGPRVRSGVVEREQEGPRGQVDLLPLHEAPKGPKVDGLVAGVRDHRHLLGEVVDVDPVGGVCFVGEIALLPDAVVEKHRDGGSIRG